MIKDIKKRLKTIIKAGLLYIIIVLSFVMLLAFTRGNKGNPIFYQTEHDTRIEGPFELSNSTSRYALTEAIVEQGTFFLDGGLAKFSSPDLVYYNGKFFSIFTPGVSLVGIPFYIAGKGFYTPQLFTFFSVSLFAFLNILLVMQLAKKMGANSYEGLLGGLIFDFGTNALSYSLTFTQHHMSTTCILLALLNSTEERTVKNDVLFGAIVGVAALFDIPNLILLTPTIIYVLVKHFQIKDVKNILVVNFKMAFFTLLIGVLPFVGFFAWYNYDTTGSFTKIGQTIGRTTYFANTSAKQNLKVSDKGANPNKPIVKLPFETRNQLGGLYTLLLSDERSWLFYSPILLLSILGIMIAYKKREIMEITILSISVVVFNIVIYSMFGDPWGGWAFGPRYLIPSAAICAAFVAIAVQRFRKNPFFAVLFFALVIYSVFVSTLGAITTNAIPPKVEAVSFKPQLPYTYTYNLGFVEKNQASTLIYNLFLSPYIKLNVFLYMTTGFLVFLIAITYLCSFLKEDE